MRTIHIARLETRHFSFESFADDPADAYAALLRGWQRHAKQTDADPDYCIKNADSIELREVSLDIDACYRDKQPI